MSDHPQPTSSGTNNLNSNGKRARRERLKSSLVIAVLGGLGFAAFGAWTLGNSRQRQDMRAAAQAREAAKALAVQVLAERQTYTKTVIMKAKAEGIPVIPSPTFENVPGGVPLPATFVHRTSALVNRQKKATHTLELLSLWNLNPNKGPRDEFEKQGLKKVAEKPDHVYEALEVIENKPRYRAVIADVANVDACVNCHNKHPKSPKTDYMKGDVMGGVVITLPLSKPVATSGLMHPGVLFVVGSAFLFLVQLPRALRRREEFAMVAPPRNESLSAPPLVSMSATEQEEEEPILGGSTRVDRAMRVERGEGMHVDVQVNIRPLSPDS
jgi:hypothetical protein